MRTSCGVRPKRLLRSASEGGSERAGCSVISSASPGRNRSRPTMLPRSRYRVRLVWIVCSPPEPGIVFPDGAEAPTRQASERARASIAVRSLWLSVIQLAGDRFAYS